MVRVKFDKKVAYSRLQEALVEAAAEKNWGEAEATSRSSPVCDISGRYEGFVTDRVRINVRRDGTRVEITGENIVDDSLVSEFDIRYGAFMFGKQARTYVSAVAYRLGVKATVHPDFISA